MAYSDFTLKTVKAKFGLQLVENKSLFSEIASCVVSEYLLQTLKRNIPLALAINTEKARSELIIINVLLEIKTQLLDKISLFSGIDFTVDKENGLAGFCDYIVSQSSEQFYLDTPLIMVVEAKNENINNGLGQCIAEMYAAQLFNSRENKQLPAIYGAVTTGDEWKFLRLHGEVVLIDKDSYYINEIAKIVGILTHLIQSTKPDI
ncbi:MAG: hypothetical protein R3E08_11230 [Thiotrichaceae bacterium]